MATKPKKPATALVEASESIESVATDSVADSNVADDIVTADSAAAAAPATPEASPFPALASPLNYDELAELGRENLNAMLKANEALSEGLEAIGKELVGFARTSFERASTATTALLGAKTLDEVVQLNTDLARASVEAMLQRSAKLSEMGLSVATQTLAPLGGRVEAAFAFATKSQAA